MCLPQMADLQAVNFDLGLFAFDRNELAKLPARYNRHEFETLGVRGQLDRNSNIGELSCDRKRDNYPAPLSP
jgi:hypothetical protein